ncbi:MULTISPECIES: HpcH/HpaI aldolase/citrate lyase family protein [Bacillaceae]|uniref:HpcH/HpaI aldolase/citrate lyase family protein n=1 Tax=Bacillaceae TaxID=186817 RepID=UPI000C78F882|nr:MULTISPECIES: HpcH/HpaI aldolase/citrate lyase family protein [Bacillaceae]PLR67832.1 citrate lyase subunit beta [Bacillus sp. UMB0893]
MKHFQYLPKEKRNEIFLYEPIHFSKETERETLAYTLGATLYMPGNRTAISSDVLSGKFLNGKHEGLTSMVICLEDSIGDTEVEAAEDNTVKQIETLSNSILKGQFDQRNLPLIFVRIRNEEQMKRLALKLEHHLQLLSGFVFPKFTSENGRGFYTVLQEIANLYSVTLYGMPILETKEIIYKESRMNELLGIKAILDDYYELVLNVRLGGTDLSGLFGIRRSRDTTIYDISVIRDCITDIINVFGRCEKEYIISGPVWEYFGGGQRILKPQIRQTPFQQAYGSEGLEFRANLIDRYDDGLIHEIVLDNTNGLVGKTIIHPLHIKIVNALNAVTKEEYLDASAILDQAISYNGVIRSEYSNKMNEIKPHYNWARKIILKSKIYGVFHEQQSFIDLINETANEQIYI